MLARARTLADVMKDALGAVAANAVVGEIRQAGLLCGIEFVTGPDSPSQHRNSRREHLPAPPPSASGSPLAATSSGWHRRS